MKEQIKKAYNIFTLNNKKDGNEKNRISSKKREEKRSLFQDFNCYFYMAFVFKIRPFLLHIFTLL